MELQKMDKIVVPLCRDLMQTVLLKRMIRYSFCVQNCFGQFQQIKFRHVFVRLLSFCRIVEIWVLKFPEDSANEFIFRITLLWGEHLLEHHQKFWIRTTIFQTFILS